jgi:drug/metabolite transporter (DMT)-like permease
LFALAVAGGVALLFAAKSPSTTAPHPRAGNLIGAASGVTWAMTLIGLRAAARKDSGDAALAAVLIGNIIACAATAPLARPFGFPGAANLAIATYLGVVQIGLAYVCFARGVRKVPAFEASTIGLLEPALNPVWTWLVHGENPGAATAAGGVIILSATLVNTWVQTRRARRPA